MTIIKGSLKQLISENKEQLDELFQGSALESNLRQCVKLLWAADNQLQAALKQTTDDATHRQIEAVHNSVQKLAFDLDGQTTQIARGQNQQQGSKLHPRHWMQKLKGR